MCSVCAVCAVCVLTLGISAAMSAATTAMALEKQSLRWSTRSASTDADVLQRDCVHVCGDCVRERENDKVQAYFHSGA